MHDVNVAFQMIPRAEGKDIYSIVDEAIKVVQESGVKYEVCPFETVMEGDLDDLLDIVKRAQEACVKAGASDVFTNIKIQYSAHRSVTIDEKVHKYRKS